MRTNLRHIAQYAIDNGMVTGNSPAEVVDYDIDVVRQAPLLEERALADWMLQRIEDGALRLEDIPVRLARYGLMDPLSFSEEMRERMGMDEALA